MTFIDWLKNENNPKLDQSIYLFGARHITLLIFTVFFCILFTYLFKNKGEKAKDTLFTVFASILLFFEITSRIINLIFLDSYTLENIVHILLPMHICSVVVWVIIIGIYSKNKLLLNYGTICGLLATLAFLLYPAVGINQKYMAFTNIYSTVSHMLGFIIAITMLTLKRITFELKKVWQPYLCFTIMFSYGALLNFVIFPGSDYMYMRNDPLSLNINFPYQILYLIIIAIYTFSFYIPVLIQTKKNNHSTITENK